jgi:hypothetical protein
MAKNALQVHLHALHIGLSAARLGARVSSIATMTGLSTNKIKQSIFAVGLGRSAPNGSKLLAASTLHKSNLFFRFESSVLATQFERACQLGLQASEGFVAAYRRYCECIPKPIITFDQGLELVRAAGIAWNPDRALLQLAPCSACQARYLALPGAIPKVEGSCPFCTLETRIWSDPRIRRRYAPDVDTVATSPISGDNEKTTPKPDQVRGKP